MYQAFKSLLKKITKPHSNNKEESRREYLLNVLLLGLLLLVSLTFLINLINPFFDSSYNGADPLVSGVLFAILLVIFGLSKSKKSYFAAYLFIVFLCIVGIYMQFYWGADLPVLLLFFALLIVMSGLLISKKFAFSVALIGGFSTIFFTQVELMGFKSTNSVWRNQPIEMVDSIVHAVILGIIAMVSWLSNRELEKALLRAKRSEFKVKKQRDNLEVLVEKRTKQLRLLEAEKLVQVHRFAEFGRIAAGLFHDFATPLNLVSINLDKLTRESRKNKELKISDSQMLMKRALDGTKRLEVLISSARKQTQIEDLKTNFSIVSEIDQVLELLDYKAKKQDVLIIKNYKIKPKLQGNPSRFSQMITNLVLNAIDSYENSKKKNKKVEINLEKIKNNLEVKIQDWGIGIKNKDIENIFEPFFTTKSPRKGLGMGLSICKDVVEKDFKGKIFVESSLGDGTIFKVEIPLKKT